MLGVAVVEDAGRRRQICGEELGERSVAEGGSRGWGWMEIIAEQSGTTELRDGAKSSPALW